VTDLQTFSISGTVSGDISASVTISVGTQSTQTASDGTFTISGLTDGTYTVTPALAGYTFTPESADVTISGSDVTDIDFTSEKTEEITLVAADDSYPAVSGKELSIPAPGLLGNDIFSEKIAPAASAVAGPSNGQLTLNSNGSFTYTANSGFTGTDSFTYKISDNENNSSNTATVTITVYGSDETDIPPAAVGDTYPPAPNTTLNNPAPGKLANDFSLGPDENATLTAELADPPEHGTVTLNPDGSFSYTPDKDFGGTDTFSYNISDGTENSLMPAVVSINVKFIKVTLGITVEIQNIQVDGMNGESVFDKPAKIYGIVNGKKAALKKVKMPSGPTAKGIWSKKIPIFDKKAVKSGYAAAINDGKQQPVPVPLKVSGKSNGIKFKDSNSITVLLVPPYITGYEQTGITVSVEGLYFGSKVPQVLLEPEQGGKAVKLKVDKKGYIFDPETGIGSLKAQINTKKIQPGIYNLIINNKIGIGVEEESGNIPVIEIQ
jgi:VCBS repeat-containing protein